MAFILHIETSTTNCSVALSENNRMVSLCEENQPNIHASSLTLFIEKVLKEGNIKTGQLDAIAVGKGPGSYTGLRIGVSTAKGLCYALDKPLIVIDTLKIMTSSVLDKTAQQYPDALFCPMIDARRMEVYSAIFDRELNVIKATSADIIDVDSYRTYIEKQPVFFFGDGAEKCKDTLAPHPNIHFIDRIYPSAKDMTGMAMEKYEQKDFADTAYFEPYYLKEFLFKK